jgi:hypothetical protein
LTHGTHRKIVPADFFRGMNRMRAISAISLASVIVLGACSAPEDAVETTEVTEVDETAAPTEMADIVVETSLFERLFEHCGQSYQGAVTTTDERDAAWAVEVLTIEFRECSDTEIRIPLHVGENRSRTWIISSERVQPVSMDENDAAPATLLRLQHDHRHEDGTSDVLTMYGGYANAMNSTDRVEFPADQYSKDLFEREGIPDSMANTWTITLSDTSFTYALDRPNRHFAAEFDLTVPVETPPAPWGAE